MHFFIIQRTIKFKKGNFKIKTPGPLSNEPYCLNLKMKKNQRAMFLVKEEQEKYSLSERITYTGNALDQNGFFLYFQTIY